MASGYPVRRTSTTPAKFSSFLCFSRATLILLALLWYIIISKTNEIFPAHTHISLSDGEFYRRESGSSVSDFMSHTTIAQNNSRAHDKDTNRAGDIGFAVTITECGDDFPIEDAASVLQYSLKRVSIHGTGRYDFVLYAIYHPDAEECVKPLEGLGYTLLKRDIPIKVDEIKGDYLREKIEVNGCCGAKELIKLEAFTLVQHKIIVLLDLDVLILKPLDLLFDFMLYGKRLPGDHFQSNVSSTMKPDDIALAFTFDYNMLPPERPIKPVQGGFVIFKPNQTIYDDMVSIVRKGDYNLRGWEGKTGKFWGSMTWQGLLPYYFHVIYKNHSIELNRCIYDNMVQNPRLGELRPHKNETERKCYTATCEDCRRRPIEEIYSAHFTQCMKPWTCSRLVSYQQKDSAHLCRQLHHAWFQLRFEMEKSWNRTHRGDSIEWHEKEHFFGFCNGIGMRSYLRIQKPFGEAAVED
jgi:hypothetical protein